MRPEAPDSLLNEAGFLAELASLDEGLTTKRRTPLSPEEQRAYEPLPNAPLPVRTTPPGKFKDEDEAEEAAAPEPAAEEPEDHPSVLGQVAAAAMFVLMMGVGAAGAAVVFHERVARILAAW